MRLRCELNHQPCDLGRRKNDAPNHSATLPTNLRYILLVLDLSDLTGAFPISYDLMRFKKIQIAHRVSPGPHLE